MPTGGCRGPPAYRPKSCTGGGKTRKSTAKNPCPMVTPPKTQPPVRVYVDDSLYGKPTGGPGWTGSYMPTVVRPVRPLGRIGVYQWDPNPRMMVFCLDTGAPGWQVTDMYIQYGIQGDMPLVGRWKRR